MIPTLTISGLQLAGLLGGTVVLKAIFAWPRRRPRHLRSDHPARLSDDPIRCFGARRLCRADEPRRRRGVPLPQPARRAELEDRLLAKGRNLRRQISQFR